LSAISLTDAPLSTIGMDNLAPVTYALRRVSLSNFRAVAPSKRPYRKIAHAMPPGSPLRASIIAHWDAGRLETALAEAWTLYDGAPRDLAVKALLADLLAAAPQHAPADRAGDLLSLIRDPDVNPARIARAGWQIALQDAATVEAGGDMTALAAESESNLLVHALLEEAPVTVLKVERIFTALRRWLLLEAKWQSYPKIVEALLAQARLNGGAWLFEADERSCFGATPMAGAYVVPRATSGPKTSSGDAVTDAVGGQYEAWPYPQWARVTRRPPKSLRETIALLDPDGPDVIPAAPEILIAGCGTGREVAYHRVRYPDARVTAVDISGASLGYAAGRLAQTGLYGAELLQLDLHGVAALGCRFDFISCIGVLHHLPDPENGWGALTGVLKPGGVMQIMVYSAAARLRVRALRARFADLQQQPLTDDSLREARRRTIAGGAKGILGSPDFFSLAGVHDLLLHRHEDPFDVRRICAAIDALGLELLTFRLPNRHRRLRYRIDHPDDPLLRDRAAWEMLEKTEPLLFAGMLEFWCRKPVTG
jgi:SAM-dependent methyltransferase